jgi:tetratricopeptide (TPR) repeat protein
MAKDTSGLLTGRWQIPLALVAATVGGMTLLRLIPWPGPVDVGALLTDVAVLEQAGNRAAAADAVANLLEMRPPLPPEEQAVLNDRLAGLLFRAEQDQPIHNVSNIKRLQEHDRAARDLGYPASPLTTLRGAFAHQWLGEEEAALKGFRSALDQDLPIEDRRAALRAVVELLERRPEAKVERQRVLEHLLTDEAVSPGYLWWGLHRAIRDALDENDTLRARELLARYGDRLKNSEFRGYLDYLSACIMLHEGHPEEAAPVVRWIDQWLGKHADANRELDYFGRLPSLNRWLMGKIHLVEERPQEALAEFKAALEYEPGPELRVAATVGCGLALAALDRHSDAVQAFREVATEVSPGYRPRAIAEFQAALTGLFDQQQARGDWANALAYLELAAELAGQGPPEQQLVLCERLGREYQAAARQAQDAEQRRLYHERAGAALERAAGCVPFDESRRAELTWSAADEYDQAGRTGDMRRLLGEFVERHSADARMPLALLQLGRACDAYGELNGALRWYARVMGEYPRLEEAARAKVLSAGVLIALGPERYADAERALAELLTSDAISPDASVYRDALLTLCDLLYYRGRYAEAISRLQDFLALYPDDPERFRGRFMLADSHRRSAYALRDDPPAGSAPGAAAAESQERFRRAADLYAGLLSDLERVKQADPALELYARLSLFYRGDCLFELNEPDTLQAALTAYRNAAARYDGQPAALTAQVQIANVFVRLGSPTEAARAVERARWLLRSIPGEAYGRPGSDRAEWERFLAVVSSSDVFKNVLADTP